MKNSNIRVNIYFIVGAASIILRFILNFQVDLIPGLNGGYYPVQIRAILLNGALAFPDLPLLFYFNVLFVKFISFFISGIETVNLIIPVSKIIDSIALPLILIPVYLFNKNIVENKNIPVYYETAQISFITLSFSPLYLISDFQKNAFGLPLMMFFIYYFLHFLKYRKKNSLIIALIFLIITGMTHFGVFCFSLFFLISGIAIFFRRKYLIWILVAVVLGIIFIAAFDFQRVDRLLHFWERLSGPQMIFRIKMYPHGIITLIASSILIGITILVLARQKDEIPVLTLKLIVLFLIFLLLLSFPFIKFEWGRRLGLIVFIPQAFLLILIYPFIKSIYKNFTFYFMIVLICGSLSYHLLYPKQMPINEASYADLKELGKVIERPGETIIVTRHGLEWWIAWELKTKIASAHRNIADTLLKKNYKTVLVINQKRGINNVYPGNESPFNEPDAPEKSDLIYSSEIFNLFEAK